MPGAAAGASAGAYVGGAVLSMLGLKSLVEGLAHAIPAALRCYEDGFLKAWGPVGQDPLSSVGSRRRRDPAFAAFDLANGHVIMIMAILTAMMAYLTRGRGDEAALLQEIGRSPRLGPRVAAWIEQNQDKLRKHPALQSRRSGTLPREQPSAPERGQRSGAEAPRDRPPRMPQAEVPCFKTNGLPQGSVPEFDRQLAGQERGINNMTVDEYIKGRDAFESRRTVRDPNIARQARAQYQDNLQAELTEEYQAKGFSARDAERAAIADAADRMKTLAALHNPDMVSAGKDVISDFGDRSVNSRIGAQWKKGMRLKELDDAADNVPTSLRNATKMNAKLERCR